jgi:hypothetical protein
MYNHLGTLAWKYDSQNAYLCNQYARYPRKCTAHYIKTSALCTLALDAIKRVSVFALSNGEEFTRQICEASELRSASVNTGGIITTATKRKSTWNRPDAPR